MKKPEYIDMRGLLSFHITWVLRQRRMCGEELIETLGNLRDDIPSPGTLYPALKKLKEYGLISSERENKRVVYTLTPKGIKDLDLAISYFKKVYSDIITGQKALQRNFSYDPKQKVASNEDDLPIDYI